MFKEGPNERSITGIMDRNRLMAIYSIIKKKKKKKTEQCFTRVQVLFKLDISKRRKLDPECFHFSNTFTTNTNNG